MYYGMRRDYGPHPGIRRRRLWRDVAIALLAIGLAALVFALV